LLQDRAELAQALAVEVLELVERDEVAGARELADHAREIEQRRRARDELRIDLERFERIDDRGEHACRTRVGDLDVEDLAAGGGERLLDERGLADAAPAGHLDEEPAPSCEDLGELAQLGLSAVEAPRHKIKVFISCPDGLQGEALSKEIVAPLYLNFVQ
jgi:hypothetical protein